MNIERPNPHRIIISANSLLTVAISLRTAGTLQAAQNISSSLHSNLLRATFPVQSTTRIIICTRFTVYLPFVPTVDDAKQGYIEIGLFGWRTAQMSS